MSAAAAAAPAVEVVFEDGLVLARERVVVASRVGEAELSNTAVRESIEDCESSFGV